MKITLKILNGKLAGKAKTLSPGRAIKIGRADQADITIAEDSSISRIHFSLEQKGEECRLQDLGSRNGVLVNKRPVKQANLKHGDIVTAGNTQFLVTIDKATSPDDRSKSRPARSRRPIFNREFFQKSISSDDYDVRKAALHAAAWQRQSWLLEHCRQKCIDLKPENMPELQLLAILGEPADLALMLSIGQEAALGKYRFEILGIFGHPGAIDLLLQEIDNEDAETAIAAGLAYTHITGFDIESDQRVTLKPESDQDLDDVEQEFLEEGKLPDVQLAAEQWARHKSRFEQGTRWAQGIHLSTPPTPATLNQLNMQSRWEACLRGRFYGHWEGKVLDLQTFPLPD